MQIDRWGAAYVLADIEKQEYEIYRVCVFWSLINIFFEQWNLKENHTFVSIVSQKNIWHLYSTIQNMNF